MNDDRKEFVKERIAFYKEGFVKIKKDVYKLPKLSMEVKLKKGTTLDSFLEKYVIDSFRVNGNYRRWN